MPPRSQVSRAFACLEKAVEGGDGNGRNHPPLHHKLIQDLDCIMEEADVAKLLHIAQKMPIFCI
jgi:hypothetical protein